MEDFDFNVSLNGNTAYQELAPLGVNKFGAPNSATSQKLTYSIQIGRSTVDHISVSITSGQKLLLLQKLAPSYKSVGKHLWTWDGFDSKGSFDSVSLKNHPLTIVFEASKGSKKKTVTKKLSVKSAQNDWVDIHIDKASKHINVTLRLNFKEGGARGINEPPPEPIQNWASFKGLRAGDPRKGIHMRQRSFSALKQLALSGIQKYWSRVIKVTGGASYTLHVTPEHSSKNSMDDIKLIYNTNRPWLRSSNPGSVKGFISLFGNFVGEKISYNAGWIGYENGWGYERVIEADKEFSETAAHEIGHEILGAYGGDTYSYAHKDSSTLISQERKPVSQGGVSYPKTGEIDLMKYYNGAKPKDFYKRVKASEEDVESLLWLGRLELVDQGAFNDTLRNENRP